MKKRYLKLLAGYQKFKDTYLSANMNHLAELEKSGQKPFAMIVACSDSRVDPALLLQADFGDLFVVRNVANIVPEYNETMFQSTAAALQFGINNLAIPHLIILGHSSCAGINNLMEVTNDQKSDAVSRWVAQIQSARKEKITVDDCAKRALHVSREHCMSYPWIVEKLKNNELMIHLWFFSLTEGALLTYCPEKKSYEPLTEILP